MNVAGKIANIFSFFTKQLTPFGRFPDLVHIAGKNIAGINESVVSSSAAIFFFSSFLGVREIVISPYSGIIESQTD